MTSSPSISTAELWQIDQDTAKLCATNLHGEVKLGDPATGIGQLVWNDRSLVGSILGLSAGESALPQDAFARGTDLVAGYRTTESQDFSWQVYWRAVQRTGDVMVIDAIVSLQTDLLESFPGVRTQSQLSAGEVWLVGSNGESKEVDAKQFGSGPADDCDCVVLRTSTGNWSYAEMTHPLDQGTFQLSRSENGQTSVQRELGGSFLEKGVIRRLRLRGAFLPRENDLQQAAWLFTEFAAAEPPLTV